MKPVIHSVFDKNTNTVSHIVADPVSRECAVIDPVMDFDLASGQTGTTSADHLIDIIRQQSLSLRWILETHVHADHLSSAAYLRQSLGGQVCISEKICAVQQEFARLYNIAEDVALDGSQFDRLLADNDSLPLGESELICMATPGHTPACMTFLLGDCAFVGDTLFMPDFGSARCDFPGGGARILFQSIQKILALPAETRLFMCHDYLTSSREEYCWETTVARQLRDNIHVHEGVSEDDFVRFRATRDAELSMPALILPAIQVNIRAGELPDAESNGIQYLKLPLNAF